MKKLQVAPLPEQVAPDFAAKFPDDIARLVATAANAGFEVSPEVAAQLWARYSDGLCATWLSMSEGSDETVLECLLKHAVIIDAPSGVPAMPAGYQTWLDYAVATMELPAPEVGALTDDELAAARLAMRDAARTELSILRRLADCARR
ncbi:hypothetical protein GPA27_03510 [Aromatoleum toluolicum]|uniref:Uncharacterized protein n=1 Tax=Aromatoleum toluolicum TaxID=90060 RepID=A0ABX1NB22_9RHOO|nr:hypothetical protein [Aromatoleum toluolicum]NMF96459.1 hypothetical protein [Aromatoleum toluolicum]